jgi:Skp family chaperone for outer membrane proteins
MKDFLFPAAAFTSLAVLQQETASFWERVAEKWGIGFVGMALLFFLAKWTAKREAAALLERDHREDAINKERLDLLKRNNELQEQHLAASQKHSTELKNIIKDGNKYQADVGVELKNLARRVNCPPPCLTHAPLSQQTTATPEASA